MKTCPGWVPRKVVSGQRESEQPRKRSGGDCPFEQEERMSGWEWENLLHQSVLDWRKGVRGSRVDGGEVE